MTTHLVPNWLYVLVLACSISSSLVGQAPLSKEEIEARKKTLDKWAFEPVALTAGTFRILFDRKDSSFVLHERRSGHRFFSSIFHRGFAAVELADGRVFPVDRVEALDIQGERVRFRAASTAGELPAIWFEIATEQSTDGASIRFEIPEDSREKIASVRLLDSGLWITDAEEGGITYPRGLGEWISPDVPGEAKVDLEGFPQLVPGGGDTFPRTGYSAPLIGLRKHSASLLVYWDTPDVSVHIERRAVDDERFPGRRGVFLSLASKRNQAKVHLVASLEPVIGLLDVSRIYREIQRPNIGTATLRYKTGFHPELRPLLGTVFFRPSMTSTPSFPAVTGQANFTFDEVASIAERLKEKLELDQAMFLLNDWLGTGAGSEGGLFTAATECGGDAKLSECARRVKEAGFLFGLAVDREQVIKDASAVRPTGANAWIMALETAQSEKGFPALKSRVDPQLLVVREPAGEKTKDPEALFEARDEFARYTQETFHLWGSNLGSSLSIQSAGYLEGLFSLKDPPERFRSMYPLFAGAYGQCARLALPRGEGLDPDDAAGVLIHLMIGAAPAFALPPHLYHEKPPVEVGDSPAWCFARAAGWAEGRDLHPRDVFIKNVSEVCCHVANISAREPIVRHRFLTDNGLVRESHFGLDMRIVVNFGTEPYKDEDGTILPQYGFVVQYPFFHAFHALHAGGVDYETPAFFTVRSLEGKMYLRAEKTRIYHGFGPDVIRLAGREFKVPRVAEVKVF